MDPDSQTRGNRRSHATRVQRRTPRSLYGEHPPLFCHLLPGRQHARRRTRCRLQSALGHARQGARREHRSHQNLHQRIPRASVTYFAAVSACIIPNVLPSVSNAYASHPTPGMAIFGSAIVPPFATTVLTDSSRFVTPTVLTLP